MQLLINNRIIYYQIQYTKADKLIFKLTPEGHVTVKAPLKTPLSVVETFLEKNAKSIFKLYDQLENRVYVSSTKSYQEGSNFLFLGAVHKLEEIIDLAEKEEAEIQLCLKNFYTKKTKEITKDRVAHYEKQMKVSAKSISIVNSPKTWGTCNSHRELTFNYKLSMAAPCVIDYVVIHELCHIYHLNHDRAFWRLLGSYDTNFKEHQAYLTKLGPVMTI